MSGSKATVSVAPQTTQGTALAAQYPRRVKRMAEQGRRARPWSASGDRSDGVTLSDPAPPDVRRHGDGPHDGASRQGRPITVRIQAPQPGTAHRAECRGARDHVHHHAAPDSARDARLLGTRLACRPRALPIVGTQTQVHQSPASVPSQQICAIRRGKRMALLRRLEGVSELLIPCQMRSPNSSRLMKRPMTRSCIVVVLEKHIVRRTRRLIRVRILMCLLSIFCVCSLPT